MSKNKENKVTNFEEVVDEIAEKKAAERAAEEAENEETSMEEVEEKGKVKMIDRVKGKITKKKVLIGACVVAAVAFVGYKLYSASKGSVEVETDPELDVDVTPDMIEADVATA